MHDGNYQAAIAVLRQALAGAAPSSLTYAYALFDLGRSLRLAGDPRDAAIVLQRRLQIPNQTDVVRHELELALRAIGAQLGGKPGHGPGDGRGHGHGHH
jgi:Flp pilus assembly protein TadD